jgi:hypothetical protein
MERKEMLLRKQGDKAMKRTAIVFISSVFLSVSCTTAPVNSGDTRKATLTASDNRSATIQNAFGSDLEVRVNGASAGILKAGSSAGLVVYGCARSGTAVSLDLVKHGPAAGSAGKTLKFDYAFYSLDDPAAYRPRIRIAPEDIALVGDRGTISCSVVTFVYSVEQPGITVSCRVSAGQRELAAVSPGDPPLSVPMPIGVASAITLDYTFSSGSDRWALRVPRKDDEIDRFVIIPKQSGSIFEIPRLNAVSKISYKAVESKQISRVVVINAFPTTAIHLKAMGGPDMLGITDIGSIAASAPQDIASGDQGCFEMVPGSWSLLAYKALRSSDGVLAKVDMDLAGGRDTTVVIGPESHVTATNIGGMVKAKFGKINFRANVPGELYLTVSSPDFEQRTALIGHFGSDGTLDTSMIPSDFFSGITGDNASSVLLTATARETSFLEKRWSITAASLVNSDRPLGYRFELIEQGSSKTTPVVQDAVRVTD